MNKMKALVTGGAGFIGSNVATLLLEKGWDVRIVDNLSSGYSSNITNLDVEFVEGSINDSKVMDEVCEGIDVVFHLAACVGRQKSIDEPLLDSKTNILGTIQLLESMRKNSVDRIVYSSSAAIFGELETSSINENHPLNAESPYGVSKLAAEKMILSYCNIYNIKGVCLRYFNIYGKNQRYDFYGNVIPIFAHKLMSGKPLIIFGDGGQTRDFVNVKDVANANYLAATEEIDTGVYNLGSGDSITINKLAKIMQELSFVDSTIIHKNQRLADVKHCQADISKVIKHLGFNPSIKLYDGLFEYLNWFKKDMNYNSSLTEPQEV